MVWVNGETQSALAVSDRAVQFGDGCFTTARVQQGTVVQLNAHLERLHQGCERLLITGVDWEALRREMTEIVEGQEEGVLKVIVTRGSGGRGYSAAGCSSPARILSVSPYPQHYHRLRESGARLAISPVRLGKNPLLAGIKHLNRLEQVLIRAQLDQTDADEALVLDTDGMLVECCAANFFWRVGNEVFTPDLSASGVNGIQRQDIMRRATELGFTVSEVRAGPEVLATAEEVLITNALMPVLPVYQIETWHYGSRRLFQLLSPH